MHKRGFTVIELVFVVLLLAAASILFFVQKNDIERTMRDDQRKTAINAMYYSLEEVYFKKHGDYPRTLTPAILPSVDETLFTDPNGFTLGQTTAVVNDQELPVVSDYVYEGLNCSDDSCKSYELRSILENEDTFVKKSRHS